MKNNEHQKVFVVDNFFDFFHIIENDWKKYEYIDAKEWDKRYSKKSNPISAWPGLRTIDLMDIDKPLMCLTLSTFERKFGKEWKYSNSYIAYGGIQLREDGTPDWIHTDDPPYDYSVLIYLGETNLKSGTSFHNENDENILNVPYVKNRAVLFSSKYKHRSISNFKGRYVLSLFIKLQ